MPCAPRITCWCRSRASTWPSKGWASLWRRRSSLNQRLGLIGILLTMVDARTNLSEQVVTEVRRHFPAATFRAAIPRSVRLSEAPSHGRPIKLYDPSSRGVRAYAELANE